MRMRKLGWAGVELEHEGSTLIIDSIITGGVFDAFMAEGEEELVAPTQQPLAALVTHLNRTQNGRAAAGRPTSSRAVHGQRGLCRRRAGLTTNQLDR